MFFITNTFTTLFSIYTYKLYKSIPQIPINTTKKKQKQTQTKQKERRVQPKLKPPNLLETELHKSQIFQTGVNP